MIIIVDLRKKFENKKLRKGIKWGISLLAGGTIGTIAFTSSCNNCNFINIKKATTVKNSAQPSINAAPSSDTDESSIEPTDEVSIEPTDEPIDEPSIEPTDDSNDADIESDEVNPNYAMLYSLEPYKTDCAGTYTDITDTFDNKYKEALEFSSSFGHGGSMVYLLNNKYNHISGTIAYKRGYYTEGAQKLYICCTNKGEVIDKKVIYKSKRIDSYTKPIKFDIKFKPCHEIKIYTECVKNIHGEEESSDIILGNAKLSNVK